MSRVLKQNAIWIKEIGWFFIVSGIVQIFTSGLLLVTAYGLVEPSPPFFANHPNLTHLTWLPLVYAMFVLFASVRFLDFHASSRTQLEVVCWFSVISGTVIGIMWLLPWFPPSLGEALASVWATMSPGVTLGLMIVGFFTPLVKLGSSTNGIWIFLVNLYLIFLLIVIGYLRSSLVRSAMIKR